MLVIFISALFLASQAKDDFRQMSSNPCWADGCDTIISEDACQRAASSLGIKGRPTHRYSSDMVSGCVLNTEGAEPSLIFNGNLNVVDMRVKSEQRQSLCNCTNLYSHKQNFALYTWDFQCWTNDSKSLGYLSWQLFPFGGPDYLDYFGLSLPSINPMIKISQGEAFYVYGGDSQLTYLLAMFQTHWEIPLFAIFFYTLMITLLPKLITKPIKPRTATAIWNFSLSAFSIMGVCIVFPNLLFGRDHFTDEPVGWLNGGSYYSNICSDAAWYAKGTQGLWVVAFILSKIPELVDTLWLVLGKNEVIFLHWYHHISVLLFCWHAFAERISVGIHFCCMNYTVHGVMYFYFAMTQWSLETRKMVKPYAIWITLLQLAQMLGGITLVCSTFFYKHIRGLECAQSDSNMMAAFIMYTSYFLLFFQLFYARYDVVQKYKKVFCARGKSKKKTA